ncbi:D-sedoheptulose 7-phosphate isomerase [Candidatus Woesearchaeota archaeon]|nr:D-sedoheptulose 7-phosphate isomerase [Candidatus Woesearchaeota archaeon]
MAPQINKISNMLVKCLSAGNKVLICGNGGSAADAQHFAGELVVRFEKDRKALPSIALSTDTSVLTACGNDYGFDQIFSKQVEALGKKGDVLVAISTSGNSPNVIKAIEAAKSAEMQVIAFTGRGGGKMAGLGIENFMAPSEVTARIQECHSTVIHVLCKLIENSMFGN